MHFLLAVLGNDIDDMQKLVKEHVARDVSVTKDEILRDFQELQQKAKDNIFGDWGGDTEQFKALTLSLEKPTCEWCERYYPEFYGEKTEDGTAYIWHTHGHYDGYELGGRWYGQLALKEGKEGQTGINDYGDHLKPKFPDGVDNCRLGDIDWKRMHDYEMERAGKYWDRVFDKKFDTDVERQQKRIAALNHFKNRDEFVQYHQFWAAPAHILSRKTGWVEDMSVYPELNEKLEKTITREEKYTKNFLRIMKSFPPDTHLVLLDCHE